MITVTFINKTDELCTFKVDSNVQSGIANSEVSFTGTMWFVYSDIDPTFIKSPMAYGGLHLTENEAEVDKTYIVELTYPRNINHYWQE